MRTAEAMRRDGMSVTACFAAAAQRCTNRPELIDELGTLTWQQLDEHSDALAAALQKLRAGTPITLGIMCRNHRGFVEALIAGNRIGANVLLLNTSFAGPALAAVVDREDADAVIYDEEFSATVDRALENKPDAERIVAWTDNSAHGRQTVEAMISRYGVQRPERTGRKPKMILLTSGTTGTPKGAKPSSAGGPNELKGMLDRVPWRAEETTVIAAPMFHAWGFSQLVF